ncbi:unnamed protein product [Calypogeia fissa]
MIRGVLGWKCRVSVPLISIPEHACSFRAMESSSSYPLRDAPNPNLVQPQQQQRNHGGSINSVAGGAKLRKGSFGGLGSVSQNSSSAYLRSSPTVSIQFGTVDASDCNPSFATHSPSNNYPQLSKAPVPTSHTVATSLDGEQHGNGWKLKSKAFPLPSEERSPSVPNTKSQVKPERPSDHGQWGSPLRLGEANNDSVPATQSPSIDDTQFPSLSASSAAGNRGSSRKGRGRPTAEQLQTPLPRQPQDLKEAGGDSPTSVQIGPERERQRNPNQNRQSVHHDRRKVGDRNGAELRNGQDMGDGRDGRQKRPVRDSASEKATPIDTLGRALTRILRHQAAELNLEMSSDGYVDVQDILKLAMKTGSNRPLSSHSIADVEQAVQQDKKQRFGVKDENGRLFIRANQGHSMEGVKAEGLLKRIVSADEVADCVHGTYRRHLNSIFTEGLKRMGRNHVHFASGVPGSEDVISGMRSSCEVLIYLNVEKALTDGMKLYISENKVILTEGFEGVVPPDYFKEVLGLRDMRPIARKPGST